MPQGLIKNFSIIAALPHGGAETPMPTWDLHSMVPAAFQPGRRAHNSDNTSRHIESITLGESSSWHEVDFRPNGSCTQQNAR